MKGARIATKIRELSASTTGAKYVINRNPRNLEMLRIAYKPEGFHLDKPGRSFWYKLDLIPSGRYITAKLKHFKSGTVVTASTAEWAIREQLYKTKDTSAYVNLARVFAQRCLESGFVEMSCDINPIPNGKTDKFLKTLEENGVKLSEPPRFKAPRPWDRDRPEKPWEVSE